jgi:hypothetical protein
LGEGSGSVTRAERHQVDAEAHVDGLDLVLYQAQEMLFSREGALSPASIREEPSARATQSAAARHCARRARLAQSVLEMVEGAKTPSWLMRGSGKGSLATKSGEREGCVAPECAKRLIEAKQDGIAVSFE